MSLGPSSLGNLLVQRLDTVLGVSQPAKNRTGAHPDALRQSQPTHRLHQSENQGDRSTRETVDKARQGQQNAIQGRQDARVAAQLQQYTDSRFSPSAPTTLGPTARTILALLNQYQNQPAQGQRPLLALQQPTNQAAANANNTAAQAGGRAVLSGQTTTLPASVPTGPTANLGLQSNSPLSALSSSPTALVNAFAQALSQSVQQSGMFYESHLAQLAKGLKTPEQLQQQPQAQQQQTSNTVTKQGADTTQTQQNNPSTVLQQSGIDNSSQQLVRQQLEVLANQLFSWRGEAWPGIPLELEIQRRQEDNENSQNTTTPDDEEVTPWQTRLRVELPHLGEVEAKLYIKDKNIRLAIRAPESAQELHDNLSLFSQRLLAQGLEIEQLQISKHYDVLDDTPTYEE